MLTFVFVFALCDFAHKIDERQNPAMIPAARMIAPETADATNLIDCSASDLSRISLSFLGVRSP
jgi:hypothetical protein